MLRENAVAVDYGKLETRVMAEAVRRPEYTIPGWWDAPVEGRRGRVQEVVRSFLTGTLKGRVTASTCGGHHVYYTKNNGTELWLYKNNPSIKVNIMMAKRVPGGYIGNASSIMAMRQYNSKRLNWTGGAQIIQQVLTDVMPMVPFRMFKDAQLDINTFKIIDKDKEEMIDIGQKRKGKAILTHYTGAMVFKMDFKPRSKGLRDYKNQGQYFLFDIDRNDLAMKNMNAFLSQLAQPARTVKEAYAMLKPKEVYDAERFMKTPCPRQGEWFFIPVVGEFKNKTEAMWGRGRPRRQEAVLQSKGNRPHFVEFLSEEGYVTGKVTHGGHEHKPITLEGWHKPVPNTAVESFKITGGID